MKLIQKGLWMSIALSLIAGVRQSGFADDYDRTNKLGIGANIGFGPNLILPAGVAPGLGLRYWFTDRLGLDLGGYYSSNAGATATPNSSTTLSNGGSASLVVLLKKKNGLRLEGFLGSLYGFSHQESDSSSTHVLSRYQSVTIGAGVGAEYSFQEFPDLGFSAAVTGVGVSFNIADVSDVNKAFPQFNVATHSTSTTYATSPFVGLGVRYYF